MNKQSGILSQIGLPKQTGLSKQTFLTFGTYLLVIMLHSDTVFFGLTAAVSVILLQITAFLVLPVIARHIDPKAIPYISTIFVAVMSCLIYGILDLIPVSGFIQTGTFFSDPMFLLLLVPFLVNQAKYPESFKPLPAARNTIIFAVMIVCVSSIREIFGLGTFMGMQIIPAESVPVPFLENVSGSAFLLFGLTLLSLYIYRTVSGNPLVLAVLQEPGIIHKQPVLCRQTEIRNLLSGLLSLAVSAPVLLGLYFLTFIAFPFYPNITYLIIVAAVFPGVTALILYLLAGKGKPYLLRLFTLPWYFPAQTAVILLPFSFDLAKFSAEKGVIIVAVALLIYLICSLMMTGYLLLFSRAVKRKLLFGERPELLTGLPLYLLFAGLGFLVLSGFTAIPYMLMPK